MNANERAEGKRSFQDNGIPKYNPPRRAGFGNEENEIYAL